MALGKIKVKFEGASDTGVLSFSVDPEFRAHARYTVEQMQALIDKEKDEFTLTIDKFINSRSLKQNALLWALLEIMAMELSGQRKGDVQAEDCYIDMLTLCGAKYEYMQCTKNAYDMLKTQFRATKVVEKRRGKGNAELYIIKCYYGSSKMNTAEMNQLIDTTFQALSEMGVDATYQADVDFYAKEWERLR